MAAINRTHKVLFSLTCIATAESACALASISPSLLPGKWGELGLASYDLPAASHGSPNSNLFFFHLNIQPPGQANLHIVRGLVRIAKRNTTN